MSTPTQGPSAFALRVLILDGTPGATTLLVLAAHRALPRPDVVLIPDTGWYPTSTYEHLDRLVGIAASAGIETLWVDAAASPQSARLPLYTHTPDGEPGRLPNRCARRLADALDDAIRYLLGYPHPDPIPHGILAECILGLPSELKTRAHPSGMAYRRNRYPLVELGWTTLTCIAHLAMHDLAYTPDMACVACPNRSNEAWQELAATTPRAWLGAITTDTLLRHRPTITAPNGMPDGMPPGTTAYLHPSRVPLAQVDLDAAPDADSEACVPLACRGNWPGTGRAGGGAA